MALQQDSHPAPSGREIVDLPPIAERERRDARDPDPASSTVAAVLQYQVIAVLHFGAVPLDLVDAPCSPDFSAVGLDNGERSGRRTPFARWSAHVDFVELAK